MPKPSRETHVAEFRERLAAARRHRKEDENERARADLLQALAYAEQHLGADSREVDDACYELACFHGELNESAQELAALERRVRIRKATGTVSEIVDALQDVAQSFANSRQPDEADRIFQEALGLCDPEIEDHRDMHRMTCLYYGCFLFDQKRHAESAAAFEQGLRICALSKAYPAVAGARLAIHLAETLFALDRKAEALALIEQAAPVVCHRSQRQTNAYAKMLYFLANHYQNEERLIEADRTYDLAVLTSTNTGRPYYPNLALILQAQACNDLKLKKPARAERHLRQAVRHALRSLPPHHADVLSIRQDLTNILIPAGRYADAEAVLAEMTAAADHADFTDTKAKERYLNNLGFVQVHLEEFPKAEANLRRALALAGTDGGCYVIKNLGLMYQKMGYVAEAIREYEKALPLFEQHFGADHSVAAFIRTALAELRSPAP